MSSIKYIKLKGTNTILPLAVTDTAVFMTKANSIVNNKPEIRLDEEGNQVTLADIENELAKDAEGKIAEIDDLFSKN